MGGSKVKINLFLPGNTWERFKEMVFLKHGTTYGTLAFELEAAMGQRISDYRNGGSTHTHLAPKALELKNKLLEYLVLKYRFDRSFEGIIIAKPMLKEAIIAVEGVSDSRSINGRISLLKSTGCIKESEDSDRQHRRYIFVNESFEIKQEIQGAQNYN